MFFVFLFKLQQKQRMTISRASASQPASNIVKKSTQTAVESMEVSEISPDTVAVSHSQFDKVKCEININGSNDNIPELMSIDDAIMNDSNSNDNKTNQDNSNIHNSITEVKHSCPDLIVNSTDDDDLKLSSQNILNNVSTAKNDHS